MPKDKPLIAVLTGDVIKSRRLTEAGGDVPALLREAFAAMREAFPQALHPAGIAIFRGDSWQFVVNDIVRSFRIAVFFRAWLRSQGTMADTRVALVIDSFDHIDPANISESTGAAFTESGRLLDTLAESDRRIVVALGPLQIPQFELLNVVVGFIDSLISRWTAPQARAACGALRNLPLRLISQLWEQPVSISAVSQHLRTKRWDLIGEALDHCEKLLSHAINPPPVQDPTPAAAAKDIKRQSLRT